MLCISSLSAGLTFEIDTNRTFLDRALLVVAPRRVNSLGDLNSLIHSTALHLLCNLTPEPYPTRVRESE